MVDGDEARSRLTSEMAKKAAKERVAALKHDTDKLLKLSVELKQSVDKSDENVLSVDVIKKAEEIEKLAHSVKEKMKGPN
jgi:recombinational DNA repair protein RecT